MRKFGLLLSMLVVFSLVLSSCGPVEEEPTDAAGTPVFGEETVMPEETEALPGTGGTAATEETTPMASPAATEPAGGPTAQVTGSPQATGTAGETPGAVSTPGEGIPSTGLLEEDYRLLSHLLTFDVKTASGESIGSVDDFVLNVCEARIDYIIVAPNANLELPEGANLIIPFKAVNTDIPGVGSDQDTEGTPASGDVQATQAMTATQASATEESSIPGGIQVDIPGINQSTFILQDDVTMEDITAGPVNAGSNDFLARGWGEQERIYWSDLLGEEITTECSVPGLASTEAGAETGSAQVTGTPAATETAPSETNTPAATDAAPGEGDTVGVKRLVSANELISSELVDANGGVVGIIRDAFFEDGLDRIRFILITPAPEMNIPADNYLVVPFGAFNVRYDQNNMLRPTLYLLVELDVLQNAPIFAQSELDFQSNTWAQTAEGYWSDFITAPSEDDDSGGAEATPTP